MDTVMCENHRLTRSAPDLPSTELKHTLDDFYPEAVICVPTFKRPEMLRQTLRSLANQTCKIDFAVIVVDNDPVGREGSPIANEFFSNGSLKGLLVVETEPGNCRACNRAFHEARSRFATSSFILMIDDDEVADPDWLGRMIAASCANQADIVGGPVVPHFRDGVPKALITHPVFWPGYKTSGIVPMIYGSGNFLIRRQAFEDVIPLKFDLRYNFLGGGDLEFFTRCRHAGLRFYWEQSARIVETVPRDRVRTTWILQRGLRIGAINYHVDRSRCHSILARAKLFAKNSILVPVSFYRTINLSARGSSALIALHPLVVAIGRVVAAIGFEPEQYRFTATKMKS